MPSIALNNHPSSPCEATVQHFVVDWNKNGKTLSLCYSLSGDIAALHIPAPTMPIHTDGLWRDTCFELFIKEPEPSSGYCEFNFSPSGAWAIYHFDAYRQGMIPVDTSLAPSIRLDCDAQRLELNATIALDSLSMPIETKNWRLALSSVIKDKFGNISYWAAAHPADKPDFHHPDSFICA